MKIYLSYFNMYINVHYYYKTNCQIKQIIRVTKYLFNYHYFGRIIS